MQVDLYILQNTIHIHDKTTNKELLDKIIATLNGQMFLRMDPQHIEKGSAPNSDWSGSTNQE